MVKQLLNLFLYILLHPKNSEFQNSTAANVVTFTLIFITTRLYEYYKPIKDGQINISYFIYAKGPLSCLSTLILN